jgi:ubiquinone biosynthesis protein
MRGIHCQNASGCLKQNYKSLANLFITSGWVNADTNKIELENTLRACCEPILKNLYQKLSLANCFYIFFKAPDNMVISSNISCFTSKNTYSY